MGGILRVQGVQRKCSCDVTWTAVPLIYACLRQSIVNLLSPPSSMDDKTSSYGDIIAHTFAYLFSLLPAAFGKPNIDVPSLSRQISLVLVGAIILSSVRVVLRGVTRVSRTISKSENNFFFKTHSHDGYPVGQAFRITSRNISASLMLLLLAQLMVCFLTSRLEKHVNVMTLLFFSGDIPSHHINPTADDVPPFPYLIDTLEYGRGGRG